MIEKLTDIFAEELKLPKMLVRPQVAKLLDRLAAEGIHVTDGKSQNGQTRHVTYGEALTHLRPAGVKLDNGSHFCPHCGAHKPPVWVQPQSPAELHGIAPYPMLYDYMVIACGECRTLLAIASVGMRPKDSGGKGN